MPGAPHPNTDHMANFFDCVETRKQPMHARSSRASHDHGLPSDEPLDPAQTQAHLGSGRKQVVGDDEANGLQKREQTRTVCGTRVGQGRLVKTGTGSTTACAITLPDVQ